MTNTENALRETLVQAERAAPVPVDLDDRVLSAVTGRLPAAPDGASGDRLDYGTGRGRPLTRRWWPALLAAAVVVAVLIVAAAVRSSYPAKTPPAKVPSSTLASSTVPTPSASYRLVGTLAACCSPQALVVDPATGWVFVGVARGVGVIDASTRRMVGTIAVGQRAVGLALDPSRELLYAVGFEADTVTVIDAGRRRVVDTIPLVAGAWPSQMAMDPGRQLLFVTDDRHGAVIVLDLRRRRVIDTVRVTGKDPSVGGLTVDSRRGVVYVGGTGLVVIDEATRKVVHTIKGWVTPPQMALDEARGHLLVADEGSGTVAVIDTSTRTVVRRITAGGRGPFGVTIDSDGRQAVVAGSVIPGNRATASLTVIDLDTLRVTATYNVPAAAHPKYPAFIERVVSARGTTRIYATEGDGTVYMVERR